MRVTFAECRERKDLRVPGNRFSAAGALSMRSFLHLPSMWAMLSKGRPWRWFRFRIALRYPGAVSVPGKASHRNVSGGHVPVEAAREAMGIRASGNLNTGLLHPAEDRVPIHGDLARRRQIGDIPV